MRPRYVLEIFRGLNPVAEHQWGGAFFWRLRSRRNRKIVCIGGEPYASKANALRAFRALGLPAGTWEATP